ncbi:MAG: autotransporter-associated beta strand protein, partial [Verrucomicrobiales bacterium]
MRLRYFLVVSFGLFALPFSSLATDFTWNGSQGNGLWDDALNWDPGVGFPQAGADQAIFTDAAPGATINLNGVHSMGTLRFENNSSGYTLSGGTLTFTQLTQSGSASNMLDADVNGGNVTVSAGRLSLSSGANSFPASAVIRTEGSGELEALILPGNPLDAAALALDGGMLMLNVPTNAPPDLGGISSNLVLWLDADDPATLFQDSAGTIPVTTFHDPVGLWKDKSPGVNGSLDFDACREDLVAPLFHPFTMGKRMPGIRFDNDGSGLYIHNQLALQVHDFTVFIVDQYWGSPRGRTLQSQTRNWLIGKHSSQNRYYANGWVYLGGGATLDNDPAIGTGVATFQNLNQYYLNGSLVADVTGPSLPPLSLGLGAGGFVKTEPSKADVAEVIVYDRPLADAERQAVEDYLLAKYRTEIVARFAQTDVAVSGTSTIHLGEHLHGLSLGNLEMGANASLTITGTRMAQTLDFSGTASLDGSVTLITDRFSELTLRGITETAPAGITKQGDGTLFLPTVNSYSGSTRVESGILEVSINGALGDATTGTEVLKGASLRLNNVVYNDSEALILAGEGDYRSLGALNNLRGNSDWRGAISQSTNAVIHCALNRLRILNGIALGGHDLTFTATGVIEIHEQAIRGAGNIIKDGNNVCVFVDSAHNTYEGLTTVVDGLLDARAHDSLGTNTVGTIVKDGASLRIFNRRTIDEPITITGRGHNNSEGALRNVNVVNTLVNTLTIQTNASIRVDANSSLVMEGLITGGVLEKTLGGTLHLKNPGNDFTNLAWRSGGGGIRISRTDVLGGTSAVNLGSGQRLELEGDLYLGPGDPFDSVLASGGTIESVSGVSQIDQPIEMSSVADIGFGGAGELDVLHAFGNGLAPIEAPDAVLAMLYTNTFLADIDAIGDGFETAGLLGKTPIAAEHYSGALDFRNNFGLAFASLPAGFRCDDCSGLWLGTLTAHLDGNWNFRTSDNDNHARIYVDLDQDGFIERSIGFGAFAGPELIALNNENADVELFAGESYLVALAFHENTGSEAVEFYFTPPGETERLIEPGNSNQTNLWSAGLAQPQNGLVKTGSGTVRLHQDNDYNGLTVVSGGTLVALQSGSLGETNTTLEIRQSGTFALGGTSEVYKTRVVLSGTGTAGHPGAIIGLGDDTRLTTPRLVVQDVSLGVVGFGAETGSLSLHVTAPVDLRYSSLELGGAGDLILNADLFSSAVDIELEGFDETIFDGTIGDAQGNIESFRTAARVLGPGDAQGILTNHLDYLNDAAFDLRAAELGATSFDSGNFAALWTTTFVPSENGAWGFRSAGRIDDNISFWIDLDQNGVFEIGNRFHNRGCCGPTLDQFTPSLVAGEAYLLGFVMNDGGGGGANPDMEFQPPSGGTNAWLNLDPSSHPGLFTVQQKVNDGNALVKHGSGSATLGGAAPNAYIGTTVIQGGELVVAKTGALGTADGPTLVEDGGTLALLNQSLGAESLILHDSTLRNLSGNNTISSLIMVDDPDGGQVVRRGPGRVTLLSDAPAATLTLASAIDLRHSSLVVDGPGATLLSGQISGTGPSQLATGGFSAALAQLQPAAYFSFDQLVDANTVMNEGSLSTHSGELTDGATLTASGLHGNGLAIQPNTGQRLELERENGVDRPIDLPDDRAWTMGTWFKGLHTSTTTWRTLVRGQVNDHQIIVESGTYRLGTYDNLRGGFRPTGYEMDGGGSPAMNVLDDQWHLLVAVAHTNDTTDFYIDRIFVGTADRASNTDIWRIGNWPNQTFADTIDDFFMIDRSLSSNEVVSLWDAELGVSLIADNHISKVGVGTLTMTADNTYRHGTVVSNGVLRVNNSLGTGTGTNLVAVYEPGVLGGTGSIGGNVQVHPGGTLDPGASIGQLDVSGGVSFSNTLAILSIELDGVGTPGISFDQLVTGGAVDLNDARLHVLRGPTYVPANGESFVIVTTGGGVNGLFDGLVENAIVNASGAEFLISYANDQVTLTANGNAQLFAGPDEITRTPDGSVDVPITTLLANDAPSSSGGPLQLLGVNSPSAQGGTVVKIGSVIRYTPAPSFTQADSFTYLLG